MQTKNRLDIPFKIKAVSDSGEFEGYGSVFGVKDSYSDIVVQGAFSKTLESHKEKGTLPALLWQHKSDEPIGIYLEMKEDETGLYVKGKLLIDDDPLAKRAHAHLKAGSITGLSIGYVLNDWEYDKDKSAWLLKEIELWEISLVTFPANDEARISDVKSALMNGGVPQPSLVEKHLRDVGFSRQQAKAFMADGFKALRDAENSEEEIRNSLNNLKTVFQ